MTAIVKYQRRKILLKWPPSTSMYTFNFISPKKFLLGRKKYC